MSSSDHSPSTQAETRSPPTPDSPPVTRLALFAYALAAAWVGVDQVSKAWVLGGLRLPERGSVAVVPGLFNLTMVWNRGVSYGLMHGGGEVGRWGLSLFSAAVAIGIAWWARRVTRPLPAVALGLVMGGAVGNLIDRVFRAPGFLRGHVVDFISVFGPDGKHFAIFNVADSAITCGGVVLVLTALSGIDADGTRNRGRRQAGATPVDAGPPPAGGSADPAIEPTASENPVDTEADRRSGDARG